jgi:hypothetical protein
MDFGLLPEFSTAVQKPVENAGILPSVRYRASFYDAYCRRNPADHGLKPLSVRLTEFTPPLPGFDEAKVLKWR